MKKIPKELIIVFGLLIYHLIIIFLFYKAQFFFVTGLSIMVCLCIVTYLILFPYLNTLQMRKSSFINRKRNEEVFEEVQKYIDKNENYKCEKEGNKVVVKDARLYSDIAEIGWIADIDKLSNYQYNNVKKDIIRCVDDAIKKYEIMRSTTSSKVEENKAEENKGEDKK